MRSRLTSSFAQLAASVTLAALSGCGPMPGGSRLTPQGIPTRAEARTALIYEANLRQGPETLRAFLNDFPKGADLHVHRLGQHAGKLRAVALGDDDRFHREGGGRAKNRPDVMRVGDLVEQQDQPARRRDIGEVALGRGPASSSSP